jgi:hypothetical protein
LLPFGQSGGGIGGAAQFAVDFVSVAMVAQLVEQRVGLLGGGDALSCEEAGQAALPVKVLAFDLALGLGGAGIAETDAVEVKRSAQLGEGLGALREEEAVAIDIEFEGQAVFTEGGGQKTQVGQERFPMEELCAGADAGTIIEQVQQRVVSMDTGEPGMRGGI